MGNLLSRLIRRAAPKGMAPSPVISTLEQAVDALATNFAMVPDYKKAETLGKDPHCFATRYHHGGGRTMRNHWGLWDENSPLHQDLKKRFGLWHADDMSSLIYQCAWQKLKGLEMTPKEFAKHYHEYWAKVEEAKEDQQITIILDDKMCNR